MSKTYKHAGLTPELHSRLVAEHAALRKTHKKGYYKQFFQEVLQCSEAQARIIYQAFNNAVMERARISPTTVNRLEGIISDELFDDLKAYLSKNYTRGKTTRPVLDKTNSGLPEDLFKRFRAEVEVLRETYPNSIVKHIMLVKGYSKKEAATIQSAINSCYVEKAALTPRKVIQLEGILSRALFSEIAKYVFNHYEWPENIDSEVDRITLEYRKKDKVGRDKTSVKKYLYKALAMGL